MTCVTHHHACDCREAYFQRLKELLAEARDDIRAEVENRYPWKNEYEPDMLRYKRDMDIVYRINNALAEDKP
jgi:hypothetical protein